MEMEDGDYKVLGSLAEAVKAQNSDAEQWKRLKEIFQKQFSADGFLHNY